MTAKRILAQSDEALPEGDERKRAQIPVRTTAAVRERLIEAAKSNDRSLTQEIEQRLERTIREEEAYSPDTFDALDTIRQMMEWTHDRVGASWSDDLTAWEIVTEGVMELLLAYKPDKRDIAAPPKVNLNVAQAEALAEYEAELASWEAKWKATGMKQLRLMMNARTGKDITEQDRIGAALEREQREALGPKPEPPLSDDQLAEYEAHCRHEARVEGARSLVASLSYPIRRRRGLA